MKIAAIMHKTGNNLEGLFEKLAIAGKELVGPEKGIIVGPDYALSASQERPNNVEEYKKITERLSELSKKYNALLVPGTMPLSKDGEMSLICPIYDDGRAVYVKNDKGKDCFIQKESDAGESSFAAKYGLTYNKGDYRKNNLFYKNHEVEGKIQIEICSDYGRQDIENDTFLELILTLDKNAGIWTGIRTPRFKRGMIVCDSYWPKIEAAYYDGCGNQKSWLPRKKINKKCDEIIEIFSLEDTK